MEITLIVALTVVWLLAVAIVHLARRPPEPQAGPPTLDLGPEPPAVANLLTHRFRVTADALPATLLDLAARRFVELEHRGPNRYVCRLRSKPDETLTAYERRVVELLRKRESGGIVPTEALTTGPADESKRWWRGFRSEVVADAKRRRLSRDLLDKKLFVGLAVVAAVPALLVVHAFGQDPGMGYGVAALAILTVVRARHPQRDTRAGLEAASRWLGVRAKLGENEEFAAQPPLAVALWDRYLAYGAAFGIAPGAVRPIPMGSESDRDAWTSYGGRWRRVRVKYSSLPFPFSRGQHPGWALTRGLAVGGIAAFLLYVLALLARDVDIELDGRTTLVVVAVFAVPLLLAVAGAIQIARSVVDLWTTTEVTGQILRLRAYGGRESGRRFYVAVDDGNASTIRAWEIGGELYARLEPGQVVTASVTRYLRYVRSITPVPGAPEPAALPALPNPG